MKTVLKWLGRAALALILLLVVALGVVYAVSERTLRRTFDVPVTEFAILIPDDSASIAEGGRLARILGCYNGCHGSEVQGEVFMDDFLFGTIKSPDLTRLVATLSPGELARVIRLGVRVNGESVLVMPASSFYHLADEDLGSILAFLKSLPPSDGPDTSVRLGPLGRTFLALGQFSPVVEDIDTEAPRLDAGDGSDPVQLGRYLAMTSCTECHGPDLQGVDGPAFTTPGLAIARAYTIDHFQTLMATGVPIGGRQLDLMARMSRKRFSHFTETEVEAIHAFLLDEF
ncbi:MAG: cytochrome c [Gemmatimonadota bacterium]